MAVLTAVLRPTRGFDAHARPQARSLAPAPEEKLEAVRRVVKGMKPERVEHG